jgi:hypothetical protein
MKMIGHYSPGQYIGIRQNMRLYSAQEKEIILPAEKYLLPLVAPVKKMV